MNCEQISYEILIFVGGDFNTIKEFDMKKKMVFGAVLTVLLVLQAQALFAADYDADFKKELERNNLKNIENLLSRRSNQMNLAWCMAVTIGSDFTDTNGFNKSNCLDVLRLLVRYGADVNKQHSYYGRTGLFIEYGYPLENAVSKEHPVSVIQFLLDSGANPNISSGRYSYNLPLNNAYSKKNVAVINLLLDRGANLLPSLGSVGDNEMIRRLISKGIQIRSEQGAEALRLAAFTGHFDTVKLLVENGVNVNARVSEDNSDIQLGATAASIAYDKGEIEIYNYLKANGAIDFEPRQITQQPIAPSSTTNVYIQPSAPAPVQSASNSAPSTPTFQTGRYAWSNSGTNMTMIFNTGVVTAYLNNSAIGIWHGAYRINGNQLVITISNPTADYASLRGQTYSYTINNNTSFSGNGETWVRTGS
jgi:ankyrin repeat protein